jgi:hypothetical protein
MAIVLGIINFVVGLIIAIPILIVVVPAMFTFIAGQAQSFTPLLYALICICLYAPVTWLVNGVAVAYAESAWTLTYLQLTAPQEEAPVSLEANA